MWYFYHQESLKQTTPLVLSPSNVSELSVEVVENKEGWVETILAILKATLLVYRLEFTFLGFGFQEEELEVMHSVLS